MNPSFPVLRAFSVALLTVGLAACVAPAHAQLVTNGGFETGDFTGWTVSGNANQGAADDTFVFGNSHSGDLAAWLGPVGSNGFLSQTIATTVGQTYTLTYWLAVDTPSQDSFAASGGKPSAEPTTTNDFITVFNGQTVFTQNNLAPTDGNADSAADYNKFSYTTVATGTSTSLKFGFRNDPSEFRLDDVSVTSAGGVPPTTVPEPAPAVSLGFLLVLTLSAAALKTRRRQAAE